MYKTIDLNLLSLQRMLNTAEASNFSKKKTSKAQSPKQYQQQSHHPLSYLHYLYLYNSDKDATLHRLYGEPRKDLFREKNATKDKGAGEQNVMIMANFRSSLWLFSCAFPNPHDTHRTDGSRILTIRN